MRSSGWILGYRAGDFQAWFKVQMIGVLGLTIAFKQNTNLNQSTSKEKDLSYFKNKGLRTIFPLKDMVYLD